MSVKTRLMGRDVQLRIARGGVPLTTITAIKSLTFEVRVQTKKDGFLGESGLRIDSIFDDVGGSFTIEPEDSAGMELQKLVADKAIARRQGDEQVSITFRVTYPNGQVVKVTVPSVEFDAVPFNVSGRDAYAEMTFTYSAEKYILAL